MILDCNNDADNIDKIKHRVLSVCDKALYLSMSKKLHVIALVFLLANLGFVGAVFSEIRGEGIGILEQQKLTSHLLINLFLEKLDEDELRIFGHVIRKPDLDSHQVSYVYNVADDSLLVRLCFRLKKKILLPNFNDFFVDVITVEMDKDGEILEITTHVSPLDKKQVK